MLISTGVGICFYENGIRVMIFNYFNFPYSCALTTEIIKNMSMSTRLSAMPTWYWGFRKIMLCLYFSNAVT